MPDEIIGKRIVLRETFIEGPLSSEISEAFWNDRAAYLHKQYGSEADEYAEKSQRELLQIKQIERNASVNLWFEHDLFCQCNLWFTCHLLVERAFTGKALLVLPLNKPGVDMWLGFGSHSEDDLKQAFEERLILSPRELKTLARCWVAYAEGRSEDLKVLLEELKRILPYSEDIYEAHIARLEKPSRPLMALSDIKRKLNTTDFGTVFREFSGSQGIYGFGDLQVKAFCDELQSTQHGREL